VKIISIAPNESGAYPPIQSWDGENLPDGYAAIPSSVDTSDFYAYNGFVTLDIVDGVVMAITPNLPAWEAWKTPTIVELRAAALARIEGKCEAAIVADLTVDGIVYPMTRGTAQDDLARAVARANAGDTAIPYGPHGQFASLYTPQQVLEIDTEFYDRCIINRTYYGLLQAWIRIETDEAVLNALDYGSELPSDYTELLTAQMSAVGIDASEFVAALTAV